MAEQVHDEAGGRELRTDERGGLNPRGAVEVGPELGEVGLRFGVQVGEVSLRRKLGARVTVDLGDGARLPVVKACVAKPIGGGEGVEGACGAERKPEDKPGPKGR